METSEFEALFLGQLAIIEIDSEGKLVSIKLKYFPNHILELSEEFKKRLELDYEKEIKSVLKENYQDGEAQEEHIKTESDKGKFI